MERNRLVLLCSLLLLLLLLLPSPLFALPDSETRALLGLKELLQNPAFLSAWGWQTDFCSSNVESATATGGGTARVSCEAGYVTKIEVTGRGMSGAGASDGGEALALHLTNFTRLEEVSLVGLGLSGRLSSKFGRLTTLQYLNLTSNSFTGPLPNRLLTLPTLQTLVMDDNLLDGTLPGRWPPTTHSQQRSNSSSSSNNIVTLSLARNRIHGSIPASLFSDLSRLRSVDLDGNLLTGGLPPSLSSAHSLLHLSLSSNRLTGTIPDLLLPSQLLSLALSNNSLHGPIPASISSLSLLQFLDLSHNLLSGVPPPEAFSLPSLLSLDVSSNNLSGTFSPSTHLSRSLQFMDFSLNLFTGKLPDSMLRLLKSKRAEIRFQGNCLSTDLQPQNPFAYCQDAALASGLISTGLNSADKKRRSKTQKAAIAIGIAIAVVVVAAAVVILLVVLVVRRRRSRGSHGEALPAVKYVRGGGGDAGKRPCMGQKSVDVSSEMLSNARYISRTMKLGGLGFPQFRVYSMDELYRATDYFHESTLIGQGSHGKVYKGQLEDGTLIAIKRLGRKEAGQLAANINVWKARVERLGKCRHKHVVALLGYSYVHLVEKEEEGGRLGSEMSLVYEYVGDRTLSKKLAGKRLEGLGWLHRLMLIIGAAKGIHFLHFGSVPGIFNNDISTTNILLDQNWVPKISDFGLSLRQHRQSSSTEDQNPQGRSRASARRLSSDESKNRKGMEDKDDIYSFGLVLLEVLIGRPPSLGVYGGLAVPKELESLVGGDHGASYRLECIDPRIAGVCHMESLETVVDITVKCLSEDPMGRPSMEDVLWNLQYALQVQSSSIGGSQDDLTTDGFSADGPRTELLFPNRSRRKNMAIIDRICSEELGKPSSPNTDFFR